MREIKLNRSNNRALAFHGMEVAYASTKQQRSTRWMNVRVFKTDRGEYVVGIANLTCWDGERDQLSAEKVRSTKDVITLIQQLAPDLAHVIAIQFDGRSPWKNKPQELRAYSLRSPDRRVATPN